MLNGLDLFSGIGGIALALAPWVRPVAYCEIDRYAQAVLVSRMAEGRIPIAPIWDDVRTLTSWHFTGKRIGDPSIGPRGYQHDDGEHIDIITGGFPCQDISVAGNGAGLAGERSGLFFEIARLCGELRPDFVFLENVPAITARGGREVVGTFAALGYDCRWCVIPVGDGAHWYRWFLLAVNSEALRAGCKEQHLAAQPNGSELYPRMGDPKSAKGINTTGWAEPEPWVLRAGDDVPNRLDRIKGLGNAVVPLQARTAFEILAGIKGVR